MARSDEVHSMFTGIAGRYDLLNHLLSFGFDRYWWRRMAVVSGARPGARMLDVAAGTGDSTLALARRGAEVVSSDFTHAMLRLGLPKFQKLGMDGAILGSVGADARILPFRSDSFDGVTICYGIRNVEGRKVAYREFLRVLRPGGVLTILEFSRPTTSSLRFMYRLYSSKILPRIGGWLSGHAEAYTYLPESIAGFPDQPTLAAEIESAGFENVSWLNMTGGIVALHSGRKPC